MGKSLIIAEKPSVAGDIARALGGFKKDGDFFESDQSIISSAIGHLVELAVPEGVEVKRGKWNLENLPVLPEEFDLKPIEKTESRFNLLKRLIKRADVDALINACDAGREGELIFRNVVKKAGIKKPIRRLWLQSMTPQAIRTAFEHLRSDEEMRPLADAAVSRSESDWLVGINSTRALTAFNSRHAGGFQKTTAGRVQTPTLAILVEREEKIRAFKSRTYWEVFGDFGVAAGSYRGRWFDETFKKGAEEDARAERIWERARAEAIEQKCRGKTGTVTEEKKPQTQIPPLLYDLTTLQREANSRFGLPAGRTLQIAQALYERHKVLTYPRTDSRFLPEDYIGTSRSVLSGMTEPSLARHAAKAVENGWVHPNKRIFNDAKVSDHFAIVPTGLAPKELDEMQAKIYDMVARRFIAVFFPQAEFEVTTRITTVEGEKFKTEGKIIVKPGWLEVYGRQMEDRLRRNREGRSHRSQGERNQAASPFQRSDAPLRHGRRREVDRRRGAAGSHARERPRHPRDARRGHRWPDLRGVCRAEAARSHRHGQGHLAYHAPAQRPSGDPLQAGDDRRVGVQAQADGARAALARHLHAPDSRSDPGDRG
jgi:DNA topoisomerase-3